MQTGFYADTFTKKIEPDLGSVRQNEPRSEA